MAKKYDLPAMPFYIGDWKKDPAVSVLTREEKMIWLEMLMLMWESQERGYLTVNGQPMTTEMLSLSLNLVNQNLSKTLTYFRTLGLFSERESDGAIYSRKIVKITELSKLRKNAGSKGGNPDLVNQNSTKSEDGGYPNALNESEYETVIKEEDIKEETVFNLWITTYGQNPDPVKIAFGNDLIKKFGFKKAKNILWTLRKNNFHNVAKMESVIDVGGNVILDKSPPKKQNPEMNPGYKMINEIARKRKEAEIGS